MTVNEVLQREMKTGELKRQGEEGKKNDKSGRIKTKGKIQ